MTFQVCRRDVCDELALPCCWPVGGLHRPEEVSRRVNDVPGAIVVSGCCCLRLPAVGIRLGGMGIDCCCCCCCDSEDRSAARLIVLASRGSREAAVTTGGWPGINLVAAMMKKGERERERENNERGHHANGFLNRTPRAASAIFWPLCGEFLLDGKLVVRLNP